MTVIDHEALVVRQWYQELWDNWNLDVADELFTDDYRLHLSGVVPALDRAAAKQVVAMFSKSFPDLKHSVDEMISDGTPWQRAGPWHSPRRVPRHRTHWAQHLAFWDDVSPHAGQPNR